MSWTPPPSPTALSDTLSTPAVLRCGLIRSRTPKQTQNGAPKKLNSLNLTHGWLACAEAAVELHDNGVLQQVGVRHHVQRIKSRKGVHRTDGTLLRWESALDYAIYLANTVQWMLDGNSSMPKIKPTCSSVIVSHDISNSLAAEG